MLFKQKGGIAKALLVQRLRQWFPHLKISVKMLKTESRFSHSGLTKALAKDRKMIKNYVKWISKK